MVINFNNYQILCIIIHLVNKYNIHYINNYKHIHHQIQSLFMDIILYIFHNLNYFHNYNIMINKLVSFNFNKFKHIQISYFPIIIIIRHNILLDS